MTDAVSEDDVAGLMAHEAFHVFQKRNHPSWFANEVALFTFPSGNADILTFRILETNALRRALEASPGELGPWLALALAYREKKYALLAPDHIEYEQMTEMNEGLARYVESRVTHRAPDLSADYGAADVRIRAYDTGHALAVLLDQLDPDWRQVIERGEHPSLDLLANHHVATTGPAEASFTADELDRAKALAARKVRDHANDLTATRAKFDAQAGWTIYLEFTGGPAWPQSFDPMNVVVLEGGEVLHRRMISVGNDAVTVTVDGAASISKAAGAHPLFDGVFALVVSGLAEKPQPRLDSNDILDTPSVRITTAGDPQVEVLERAQTMTLRIGPSE